MAATASNTNTNAIKEDEDAIPIFVVRTPKPGNDADDDIPVFTPGNHDMDDLDPVVWAPDDEGRICSGSIANGDCPGPQLGLPFGSSCGVVASGVQGCRANARFVSSNSTVRE
ncbi:hypothetical protein P43SY_005318 [Pythium insidiosum]|uniref:Uncharacterized protein n=1 Tax=Pythium insidiosum TaxID=114742 RepID=A0AAD5LR79_PYTIN|nr:hypothetical protein P43SY_005318 [Pythium insidiosum]